MTRTPKPKVKPTEPDEIANARRLVDSTNWDYPDRPEWSESDKGQALKALRWLLGEHDDHDPRRAL